jgi:hypothetical protein
MVRSPRRGRFEQETNVRIDNFIDQTSRTLKLKHPSPRDVRSLENWLNGTAALARDEARYLQGRWDLATLNPADDGLFALVEGLIEDALIRFLNRFRHVIPHLPWVCYIPMIQC